MDDMSKEIIFRDGWDLEGDTFDDYLKARACEVIMRGYEYGLTLDRFWIESNMVKFYWRGAKRAMLAWYNYYSRNMTSEPEEMRQKAIECIRNK